MMWQKWHQTKRMWKDVSFYLSGSILEKIIPFLLLPYVARKLGVENYGIMAYLNIYVSIFAVFIGLSQGAAISCYFYRYGEKSLNLVVRSSYAYTLFVGGLCTIGAYLYGSPLIAYALMSATIGALTSIKMSICQSKKESGKYSLLGVLSTVISGVFTVLFLELNFATVLERRYLSLPVISFCVFLLSLYLFKGQIKYNQRRFDFKQYKVAILYLLAYGLPLVLHNFSGLIKGQLDRFFIFQHYSQGDLGVYAMGANLASIVSLLLMAVNKATLPYYFEGLRKKTLKTTFIYRMVGLSLLLIPLGYVVVWLIPESLFLWILGKQYLGVKAFFNLFFVNALLFLPYFLMVNYLFYYSKNKLISTVSIASTGFYLLALYLLLPLGIDYLPYASIIGSLGILPILFFATQYVAKREKKEC